MCIRDSLICTYIGDLVFAVVSWRHIGSVPLAKALVLVLRELPQFDDGLVVDWNLVVLHWHIGLLHLRIGEILLLVHVSLVTTIKWLMTHRSHLRISLVPLIEILLGNKASLRVHLRLRLSSRGRVESGSIWLEATSIDIQTRIWGGSISLWLGGRWRLEATNISAHGGLWCGSWGE